MMTHSLKPSATGIGDKTDVEVVDGGICKDTTTLVRRHRPVTALVQRRSSRIEKLVYSVVGDTTDVDTTDDRRQSVSAPQPNRAASAPHRVSLTSFYADAADPPSHDPEFVVPKPDVPSPKRVSIQGGSVPTRPPLRPRISCMILERTPLRQRRARTKSAIQLRRESVTHKAPKQNDDNGIEGKDEDKSGSDSDSDSDSSLSTLESLKELKSRIDEIVGTRPVNASRSVRRGSASHIMNFHPKKRDEERSVMTTDSVIRRRIATISIDSRSRSLANLNITRERRNSRAIDDSNKSSPSPFNRHRARSASLASTTPGLQTRIRNARVATQSRQRAQSSTDVTNLDADGQKYPRMQRRSNISRELRDANGNMSHQARRSLRRGSLFSEARPVPSTVSGAGDEETGMDSLLPPADFLSGKRGSFEGSRRGSAAAGGSRRRAPTPELNFVVPDQISVKLARERFRRIARLVLNCVKICRRSHLNIEQGRAEFDSFIQVGTRPDRNGDRLFFDPDYFKADKSQRLSEETKRILTDHPVNRTEKELKYVQIALRNIKAFAEYPIRMQGRLCKVGWLETYGPNRAVLRQGHPPQAFYFILSGTLIVTIFMTHGPKGKPATQTVAFLRRGQSFGELAILNETVRASTVLTKSRCELLVISVEDFEDIFMVSGGIKSVNDPDQHAFLTSLRFLTHWPIHIIPFHPKDCLFHFFATGDVLVQDSNQSDWIYIVKSGSCSVLKKLKRVHEDLHPAYKRTDVSMAWNKDTTLIASIMNDGTKSPNRKKARRPTDRTHSFAGPSGPDNTSGHAHSDQSNTSVKAHGSETSSMIQPVTRKSHGVYLKTGVSQEDGDDGSNDEEEEEELDENGLPVNFVDQRRTFHTDLDVFKSTTHESTEADKDPVFVTTQLLLKGGVFGVNTIVFPDQPSLSLVSNGAECILIRKSFYLEHAPADTLSHLRKHEFPYPTEDQLQKKLQKHMNWNAYKDHMVKSVVFQTRATRTQKLAAVNR